MLEGFKAAFEQMPAELMRANSLSPLRRSAIVGVLFDGLPDRQTESWKYTSVRALAARPFVMLAEPVKVDPIALAAIPAPRVVIVNGVFDAELSQLDDLPETVVVRTFAQVLVERNTRAAGIIARRFEGRGQIFARLNTAFALDGAHIEVAADAHIEQPLHLVLVGAASAEGDQAVILRHMIELLNNASLTVIEHHLGVDSHRHLNNHVLHAYLKPGSSMTHVRVQDEQSGASVIQRTDAVVEGDATYRRLDLELGAGLSRHELNVSLQGERARVFASGVQIADDRRHLDYRIGIEHIAANSASHVQWRSLADDRGRAVFHGGISIRAGADGSDASLTSRNLLLSPDAEIDAQPVLEINADEVKAAHGATVGQLDPNAMFYLRSRGIGEAQARTLLTTAFCREALQVLNNDALAEAFGERLDRALQVRDTV